MSFRRLLILIGTSLILFLSMYTWNRSTHILDNATANIGLEVIGIVLKPVQQLQETITEAWNHYVYLVDVSEKNKVLEAKLRLLEAKLLAHDEDLAELKRLREILRLPVDESWTPVGARVLAGHLGPNSLLDSITINRGYATGATPGTPIVTERGLIGRVLRSSPHTATALLMTNPGSRIAVFTQNSRCAGILTGEGANKLLSVRYMQRTTEAKAGEILITSGLDGKFPKGIPTARIVKVEPSNYTEFMTIEAEPLVDMHHIEEILLLEPTGLARTPLRNHQEHDISEPIIPEFLKPLLNKNSSRALQGGY